MRQGRHEERLACGLLRYRLSVGTVAAETHQHALGQIARVALRQGSEAQAQGVCACDHRLERLLIITRPTRSRREHAHEIRHGRRREDLVEQADAIGIGPVHVVDQDHHELLLAETREKRLERTECATTQEGRIRPEWLTLGALLDLGHPPEHGENLLQQPGIGRQEPRDALCW